MVRYNHSMVLVALICLSSTVASARENLSYSPSNVLLEQQLSLSLLSTEPRPLFETEPEKEPGALSETSKYKSIGVLPTTAMILSGAGACVIGGLTVPSLLDFARLYRSATPAWNAMLAASGLITCPVAAAGGIFAVGKAMKLEGTFKHTLRGAGIGFGISLVVPLALTVGAAIADPTGIDDVGIFMLTLMVVSIPFVPLGTTIGATVGYRRSDKEAFERRIQSPP